MKNAKPMTGEGDVKKRVKELLTRHEWFWWMPPANGFGKGGISDFNAIKHGTFLALETKFGTRAPTALQIGFLNSVRSHDAFAFVVSDRNIDYLEAWLGAFDRAVAATSMGQKPTPEDGSMMVNAIYELSNKPLDT